MAAHSDPVVGVDGTRSGWRALDWAAEEAEATAARLVIVHATTTRTDSTPSTPSPRAGADVLSHAVARVADDRPAVRTTARLGRGRPDRLLLDSAGNAALLVVGRGGHRASTQHLGTTARRVLGHAPCPTVVVGGTDRIGSDTVVVGVSESPGGLAALRFAAERARSHGWELVGVRGADESDPGERDAEVLASWVARARAEFPDVRLHPVLAGRAAAEAIECEAVDAGLVVLGCHRADAVRRGRLGVLTSALAREVSCPVAVVGHATTGRGRRAQGVGTASDLTQLSTRMPTTSGR